MGWTTECRKDWSTIQEMFEKHFKSSTPDKVEYKVLRSALINFHEAYAAIKIIDKEKNIESVFAATYLIQFDKNNCYGYKSMTENSGPGMCNCPEKILKLLTFTDNEYAIRWRESNWKKINERKEKKKQLNLYAGMVLRIYDNWIVYIDKLCKTKLLVTRLFIQEDNHYYFDKQYQLSYKQLYSIVGIKHESIIELSIKL